VSNLNKPVYTCSLSPTVLHIPAGRATSSLHLDAVEDADMEEGRLTTPTRFKTSTTVEPRPDEVDDAEVACDRGRSDRGATTLERATKVF
jgi:hypothetical protein